jgi:hypothetical protein
MNSTTRDDAHEIESTDFNTGAPSKYPTRVGAAYVGQDGRMWRRRDFWCFPGYRSSLDVKVDGRWIGSGY